MSKNDPERIAAEHHARSCAGCRAAMDEGARLMILLREAAPVDRPTPAALARAAEIIGRENDHERQAGRRTTAASVVAVVLAWSFQLMVGSGFVVHARQVAGSLVLLALAVACAAFMRARERWALPLLAAASALFALVTGTSAALAPGIGVRCSFREMWAAALAWAVVAAAARRGHLRLSRGDLGVVAAAGALAAHAGQHLACEVPHSESHVFLFHVSVVVLVAAAGALGPGLSALRWSGRESAPPAR